MEEDRKVPKATIKSHQRIHGSNSTLKDPPKVAHEKNNERHMQSVEQNGISRDILKDGDGVPARSGNIPPRKNSDHDVGAKVSSTNGGGTGRVFKSKTERRRASYPIPTNRDRSVAQNTHQGVLGTKTETQHSKKPDPPGTQQIRSSGKASGSTSAEHSRVSHTKNAPNNPSATMPEQLPKNHAPRKNSDAGEAPHLKRAPPAAVPAVDTKVFATTTPNTSSMLYNGSKKRRRSSADRVDLERGNDQPLKSATHIHERKGMERRSEVAGAVEVDSPTRRTKKIAMESNPSHHQSINKNGAIAATAPTGTNNGTMPPPLHARPVSTTRRHVVAEAIRNGTESPFPVHGKGSPTSLKPLVRQHDASGENTGGATSNGGPPSLSVSNTAGHREEGAHSKRGGLNVLDISGGEKQRNGVGSRSLMSLKTYVNHHFFKSSLHRSMKNRAEFTPYALEYNELSVELFAAWAAAHPATTVGKMHTAEGNKYGERVRANGTRTAESFPGGFEEYHKNGTDNLTTSSPQGVLLPVAAPIFRKCQICRRYGHYEIECDNMGEEMAVKLADATKMEANMKELWREHLANGSGIQISKRGDQQNGDANGGDLAQAAEPLPSEESESVPLHLSCEVCNSRSADDRMLVCDGCDSLYHIFCLDPPLTIIPEGEWFCPACATFNDGVPSDVEIEAFGSVVVEQRKEPPRESQKRTRDSSELPSSWQISVAIVDRSTALTSSSEARAARGLGKHHLKLRKKETDEQHTIDRFVIHARSSSQSPHFTKQLRDLASVEADKIAIDEVDVSIGCVVAWFPGKEATSSNNRPNNAPPLDPEVGCVLAVDKNTNQVLLRCLGDWRKLLEDASHRSTSGATSHLEDCAINAITASATVWLPAQDVHVVARAPHPKLVTKFETEIVPSRVRKERRRSRKLALKQCQQASRARTEFAMID